MSLIKSGRNFSAQAAIHELENREKYPDAEPFFSAVKELDDGMHLRSNETQRHAGTYVALPETEEAANSPGDLS